MGTRQAIVSAAVFGVLLLMLVSFDERVRDRVSAIVTGGQALSTMGERTGDLGGALISAVKHQSIENAPLLVFASVGAVLFVFMLKA
jgi:hypothetical protein